MGTNDMIEPEEHKKQIDAFIKIRPCYETYSEVLSRVLNNACKISLPGAMIQVRAKTVSSFAEKVVRKYHKYKDAVNQLTDLCGARVVVQTTEQVKAVRHFIEDHFIIVESDDKAMLLNESTFGYRDMHYLVRLKPERLAALGVTDTEKEIVGERIAEIQVRTWVQHAWADTLHDRIYKNDLKMPSELLRTGNLLAALMEEGDNNFNFLANEIDGLIANYSSFATIEEIEKEIHIQGLILANETDKNNRRALSLRFARLLASAGHFGRVVEILTPFKDDTHANQCEWLLELGHALCRINRGKPDFEDYAKGIACLEEARKICEQTDWPYAQNLRTRASLHARVLYTLGWALEAIPQDHGKARECYRKAHEHEPANPYYLTGFLGFEIYCTRQTDIPAVMCTTIHSAIKSCRSHALSGIELPFAYFTAGKLHLLLCNRDDDLEALGYYASGIHYILEGKHCVPDDLLNTEIEWLQRIHAGKMQLPQGYEDAVELLNLGKILSGQAKPGKVKTELAGRVLIISGGVQSMPQDILNTVKELLQPGLAAFQGTVISGGTHMGIPGLVGDITGALKAEGKKRYTLVGYRPERLPDHAAAHHDYDVTIKLGRDFGAKQILCNWSDILANGIKPENVLLLGFGGGPLSATEYHIALGLGAQVAVLPETQGKAHNLVNDPLWSGFSKLYPFPMDAMTIRAFLIAPSQNIEPQMIEKMAQILHGRYINDNQKKIQEQYRPWEFLPDEYRMANLEQAAYAETILRAAGFDVRKSPNPVKLDLNQFPEQVEYMSELEHGRWNVERFQRGWRLGTRDDHKKRHNCLVAWSELSDGDEGVKKYDRDSVKEFPNILAEAGLEIIAPDTDKKT